MAANLREPLLLAACRVLGKRGAKGLTLDAVAAEAKASKGGVLYHFRSKNALFEALLKTLIDDFEREVDGFLKVEPDAPGRFVRAYIRASCREETPEEAEMGSALLAAVASDPSWARVYWPAMERWRARAIDDGLDEPTALALLVAADGFSLCNSLGVGEARKIVREEIVKKLIEWSDPTRRH